MSDDSLHWGRRQFEGEVGGVAGYRAGPDASITWWRIFLSIPDRNERTGFRSYFVCLFRFYWGIDQATATLSATTDDGEMYMVGRRIVTKYHALVAAYQADEPEIALRIAGLLGS